MTILTKSVFDVDFKTLVGSANSVLVIGNPPWVTNSDLACVGSSNLPVKSNFKHARGLEAMTGAGNFDICENIIMSLMRSLKGRRAVFAMLCKQSVARNVFLDLTRERISLKTFDLYSFDAKVVFGVNAGACLLLAELSECEDSTSPMRVFRLEAPNEPVSLHRVENGTLSRNLIHKAGDFDGVCPFVWRQGLKHDCAKVMELTSVHGHLINGLKETLDIEPALVFPLVKSSSLKLPVLCDFSRFTLVTQQKLGECTDYIEHAAPKTWKYLRAHADTFRRRKSTIYKNAPEFSMFGIGDYAFSRFKVAVSGFYKEPFFSLLFTETHRPVMADDTCYFLPFETFDDAYLTMLLLNHKKTRDFLKSISFADAKRPYTKKVLERIDLRKIASVLRLDELRSLENELHLPPRVTQAAHAKYKAKLGLASLQQETPQRADFAVLPAA